MKRQGFLFERVCAFPNLLAAYQRARRGKGGRLAVERFARDLEGKWMEGEVVERVKAKKAYSSAIASGGGGTRRASVGSEPPIQIGDWRIRPARSSRPSNPTRSRSWAALTRCIESGAPPRRASCRRAYSWAVR